MRICWNKNKALLCGKEEGEQRGENSIRRPFLFCPLGGTIKVECVVQYPTTEAEVWDRVKTVYWDMSELLPNSGIFGISSSEVNVVPAGTTLNVMSARERERMPQYGEIEERYGIFFFFRDRDVPELPFFAVPHLTLFARDGQGGWFGQSNQGEEEVYYITPEGEPFRVSSSMKEFARRLLAGEDWRELWEPAQELALYPSKEAAAQAVELVPLSELLPKDWKGAEER